jgi:hypothetical protein
MGGIHLAVDDTEIMACEKAYQMGQGDLGGVGPAREHGLAEERPADGDAIEPPASSGPFSPSIQVSNECAWPASCKARYAATIAGEIQVPPAPARGAAHSPITRANAVSARTS